MLKTKLLALTLVCLLAIGVMLLTGNRSLAQNNEVAGNGNTNSIAATPEINVCMHLESFSNTTVTDLKELEVKWVRIDWLPGEMDNFMQTMHANDINVLAIIDSNTFLDQNVTPELWNSTIKSIMQDTYANYVGAWEIWNEPNSPLYPQAWFSPQDYYYMLSNASAIIQGSSHAFIVAAGLSPDGNWSLTDLYNAYTNIGSLIDYQGVHLYGDVSSNLASISLAEQTTHKPIWVTEYGAPSAPSDENENFTQEGQAIWLQSNFEALQSHADKIFWYELYDETGQGSVKEDSFGLITVGENRKPAFYTLSAVIPAINYLIKNYNATMGLVHESPDSALWNKTYWLYSDNYLVELALEPYEQQDGAITNILGNISASMASWLAIQPNLPNQYQALNNSAVSPFNSSTNIVIGYSKGAIINSTVNNGATALDPKDYADIAFLQAIAYHNQGDNANAKTAYSDGIGLWDVYGFNDTSYYSTYTYATYKAALYILASNILNCSYSSTAFSDLISCQQSSGVDAGGFATEYVGNGSSVSGTNTETTALAILALTFPPPSPTPTSPSASPSPSTSPSTTPSTPEFSTVTLGIAAIAIFLCTLVLALALRNRRTGNPKLETALTRNSV